ncbi:MAG TPA: YncE family protein [Gemmatimonadaceae bacterium]
MRRFLIVAALVGPLVAIACQSNTEPGTRTEPVTHDSLTHPAVAGNTVIRIIGLGGRPFGLTVTASGDVFVTEQDLNRAVRSDSLGGRPANLASGRDPGDVVVSRGGTAFVSGFFDGTITVMNLSNNTVTKTVNVSSSNAYRVVLSKDESELFVTSNDGHLYAMNTSTWTVTGSIQTSASQGLTLNHAGTRLYASATSGAISRLDLPGLTTGKSTSLSCAAQDVALAADDSELYVACEEGRVMVLDPVTLAAKDSVSLSGAAPFGLAVSPDNAQLYVASAMTGSLTIIDRATRSVIRTLTLLGMPRRVAFNRLGNRAYVSNEAGWIDVIE